MVLVFSIQHVTTRQGYVEFGMYSDADAELDKVGAGSSRSAGSDLRFGPPVGRLQLDAPIHLKPRGSSCLKQLSGFRMRSFFITSRATSASFAAFTLPRHGSNGLLNSIRFRLTALEDEDLEPLWDALQST